MIRVPSWLWYVIGGALLLVVVKSREKKALAAGQVSGSTTNLSQAQASQAHQLANIADNIGSLFR